MRLLASVLVPSIFACSQSPSNAPPDAAVSTGADASALVAQCEALAATFVDNCNNEYTMDAHTPDTERVCIWTEYEHLCSTGNTRLLLDSMNCFGQNPNCWTFSDPNDTTSCLASVHAAGESAAARAFLQDVCTQCGGSNCSTVTGQAELFPYVSDTELATISACWGNACSNAAFLANCSSVPDIAAIFACK